MITVNGRDVRVVDAHVHIFPDEVSTSREDWLELDPWFRHLYENPRAKLATAEDLIASMDKARVDHSIVCGFPWSDAAHCRFHNDYMRSAADRWPDRLSWMGTTVPGEEGVQIADECLRSGALAIGELNADAQGFRWSEFDRLRLLVECLQMHDRALMMHTSEPVGHRYPGKGSATPGDVFNFVEAFPELRVVAAHWGGGLPFYELMPSARPALANVAYDSAATTYLYDSRVFETCLVTAGQEKVIYATDFPVLGQERLTKAMGAVNWPSDVAADLVLHGNAERIYRIGETR